MRNQLPPTGSFRQVWTYLGIDEDEFKKLVSAEGFPRPTMAGSLRRWAFSEIDEWLKKQPETTA